MKQVRTVVMNGNDKVFVNMDNDRADDIGHRLEINSGGVDNNKFIVLNKLNIEDLEGIRLAIDSYIKLNG